MQVNLKAITPKAEVNIVEIARVSSSRTDKTEKPEGLINYLIKNNHWSPFEHSMMTVEIVTSKAIGIQLLRHRSFTFQEFSQRYAVVEEMENIEFRLQAEKNRQSSTISIGELSKTETNAIAIETNDNTTSRQDGLLELIALNLEESFNLYKRVIEAGIAKECARMILPMSTQTTIFMSGTIRSWIHFLDIRDDTHAQLEVQLIAKEIKRIFIQELPIISIAKEYTL